MTDYTKQELETAIEKYKSAILAVSGGQSYSIDGMTVTRADVMQLKTELARLRRQWIDLDDIENGAQAGLKVPRWR